MAKIVKQVFLFSFLFSSFSSLAQFSVGGGLTTLLEFGNKKPHYGLNFIMEFPRNNEVVFYARATYLFDQKKRDNLGDLGAYALDAATSPQSVYVPVYSATSVNYIMVDGGMRYYFLNGYDEGFAFYGGTNLALIVNFVKFGYQIDKYDATKYFLDTQGITEARDKGTVIRLALGLLGGMKYTFPGRGTIFFDLNPQLTLFGIPSNQNIPNTVYKPVSFGFSLGYRKEIY
ncbi:MAG: hypothetical protein M9916_02380 [Crocinitomicaceae bacterium]|nr:hypothetical protein [Crocinitomicaceae bacterium]